tara:strand:+ start:85 stop:807 length:723 start_codon:yes stop_codon:yes gene_type:complete
MNDSLGLVEITKGEGVRVVGMIEDMCLYTKKSLDGNLYLYKKGIINGEEFELLKLPSNLDTHFSFDNGDFIFIKDSTENKKNIICYNIKTNSQKLVNSVLFNIDKVSYNFNQQRIALYDGESQTILVLKQGELMISKKINQDVSCFSLSNGGDSLVYVVKEGDVSIVKSIDFNNKKDSNLYEFSIQVDKCLSIYLRNKTIQSVVKLNKPVDSSVNVNGNEEIIISYSCLSDVFTIPRTTP